MAREIYPKSGIPIRRTVDLLPRTFNTDANAKFMAGVVDPLVQPGSLDKIVGYYGRRFGRTYNSKDVYLDTDQTLRSRYQLEPGVVVKDNQQKITNFYDYIDFKNQLKFFNNKLERDDLITDQDHYCWNPPIDWDKFVNFREYYWIPDGPPTIAVQGQRQGVTSSYKVRLGVTSTWIFFPDGLTNNPTITLYRGQTYKFQVNAPGEGFVIKTNYDTGSLLYKPYLPYFSGQLAVYDNKLWRARKDIPLQDQSTIDEFSEDWEYLEPASEASSLDYNQGVTNNGVINGTLTFRVPLDAPDILYYQSSTDINRFGKFVISNIDSNTKIDVEKEILGKTNYISSNSVNFSNGMKVRFEGLVSPEQYSKDSWIVEGVGESIKLIKFDELKPPILETSSLEVLFDDGGFDTVPFDDAARYPELKDYITINRSSRDSNSWSRYNRWFHKSVLELSHRLAGSDFDADEKFRAKRPIIEYKPHLQLFNHGEVSKNPVDFVDTFTEDVFSTIEGSPGYNVDGQELFDGARLLVIADKDSLANNRIYDVKFILHNNSRQISLIRSSDSDPILGQCVLVDKGQKNASLMYHFNGESWVKSQQKLSVNQNPLFDAYDENEISFGDKISYPVSTFIGSKILSYKVGNSINDTELNFSLSYLNIDNVGDIEFNFDWDIDTFTYQLNQQIFSKKINIGYFKFTDTSRFENNWVKIDRNYLQPIVDSVTVDLDGNNFTTRAIDWDKTNIEDIFKLLIYINGSIYKGSYTRERNTFTIDKDLKVGDIVVVKVYTSAEPYLGYYEIPLGLERNPLNDEIKSFTLGQAVDHISTALDLYNDFVGNYPGTSNLRDITGFQNLSRRFLKHSGITPTAITFLCDKNVNVIKSIQYAKKSYQDFKNNFLRLAETLDFDGNIIDFVDNILIELSKVKTQTDPFSDSDMVGSGAYTLKNYIVEDVGIKTFALSEKFSLESLSRIAVYVYYNNVQLLHGQDYTFNSNFGFVELLINLNEGDNIQIREYVSSSSCFIPPTPTKLGLYKKYVPRKFTDDTYLEPIDVIQGHDGSITISYYDFRDDAILELEKRIYNNIKQQYDESLFNIDKIIGGYYYTPVFDKSSVDEIVFYDFLKWIQDTNVDYLSNPYFDDNNSFTYTYSQMSDPTGLLNLPGWWKGVYRWFFDTDRPHICPWEMLGFSEKPIWWESEYGPAPYTKNNLILWEDLSNGIIRKGARQGTYDRYKRSTLLTHIPVDGDGNLLSPFDSGLAKNFVVTNNKGEFIFGDHAPVENAWRTSSDYPFALISALCVLRPFEFIIESLDRSQIKINKIGQTINKNTGVFVTNKDIVYPEVGGNLTSGLINYIVDYLKKNANTSIQIKEKLENLNCNLTVRLSGFVDQPQQKFLLDSKNPKSTTSSIFIPPENYDIIFNVSSPIFSPSYSGIIIEKTAEGYKIYGYDFYEPYFTVYEPLRSENDPLISVGGISENFVDWRPNVLYSNGTIVRVVDVFYRCLRSHTSDEEFDPANWQRLAKLPIVGAVEVFKRKNWQNSTKRIAYGTVLRTIQDVADVILGYEQHLLKTGFEFNGYDSIFEVPRNWTTSVKEFLFWTRHKWAVGSLITLSPLASKLELNINIGVVDNLLDSFYDYNILRDDGNVLTSEFVNVNREFQKITVDAVNTDRGIYFFKCYIVLKEHVAIFSDRTVFNDVIYDKPTGYRQERIKCRGFRTVDWDGDYTSPGFVFDNVDIKTWLPFTDYKLGDIVSYKSYNWTSLKNQAGTEKFIDSNWSRLDSIPAKGLVKNFDYNVNLFEDFYNADSDGIGASQRELARHLLGYQTRTYLQNIAEDAVTQFKIYQGFIKEKGTLNSVTKIFDKISKIQDDSITINEEWAVLTGKLGGIDQTQEVEFKINKKDLLLNPQPLLIINGPKPGIAYDKYIRINQSDFTKSKLPYTENINPIKKYTDLVRQAGYVKNGQVEIVVRDEEEILSLNPINIQENYHFWLTFYKAEWTVKRLNLSKTLIIVDIVLDTENNLITLTYNKSLNIQINDIIAIKGLEKLDGFHRVISVKANILIIAKPELYTNIVIPDISSLQYNTYLFSEARFSSYDQLDQEKVALLDRGSKLFLDNKNNNEGDWEVIEKIKTYDQPSILEYPLSNPKNIGKQVKFVPSQNTFLTGVANLNFVAVYEQAGEKIKIKQVITPDVFFESYTQKSFGDSIAVSPDGVWLAIGAPMASGVPSRFKGYFEPNAQYFANDIVLYNGQLWQTSEDQDLDLIDIEDDGSTDTLNITSSKFRNLSWQPVKIINPDGVGIPGPTNQGAVFLYKYSKNKWNYEETILSPRMASGEKFGTRITIGVDGINYYMSVSAPGALENTGRVYLYKYLGTTSKYRQQILTINGAEGVSFFTNIITFNVSHNYATGQLLYYINGTYTGDDQSIADSPPAPENYTEFYAIRIDATRIKLANSINNAALNIAIDLKEFGIDDSSSHTFINNFVTGWQQIENLNYRGVYDTTGTSLYTVDSIVWYNENFYQAQEEILGNEIPLDQNSSWALLNSAVTSNSLPTNLSLEDAPTDGSTTDSTMDRGSIFPVLSVKDIKAGEIYEIESFGNTNFAEVGYNPASSNLIFKATSSGIGTGTVRWLSYQFAELVNAGDMFGSAMCTNRDGSLLIVGAPRSNGQYFANFKGIWKSYQQYFENDVVKYNDDYYKLEDTINDSADDSSIIISSVNQIPSLGSPWLKVDTSDNLSSGKVFIYKRLNDVYELKQVISNGNFDEISDLSREENIEIADYFGYSLDIDYSGTTLIVGSPEAEGKKSNQGAVYVFKHNGYDQSFPFRLKQKLISHENYVNEFFGTDVAINYNTDKIVVGAINSVLMVEAIFDSGDTKFDGTNTKFLNEKGNTGQVYIFERKDETYLLAEKLYTEDFQDWESFGSSVDCYQNYVVVGSPSFRSKNYSRISSVIPTGGSGSGLIVDLIILDDKIISIDIINKGNSYTVSNISNPLDVLTIPGSTTANNAKILITGIDISGGITQLQIKENGSGYLTTFESYETGKVRLFVKDPSKTSWNSLSTREDLVDIDMINSISVYDTNKNLKLDDLQIVDHYKLKILNEADKEITYKTLYDPAVYTNGTLNQEVNESIAWFEENVGKLWWDLSTCKFINYEQGDIDYRTGNWNKQAHGSSIDIFEWVESNLLPSQWAALADTNEGLGLGISGQPLYADDTVYSVKILTNPSTGETTDTKYFYWVKNSTVIPINSSSRKLSAAEVALYIDNPISTGISFLSPVATDKFLAYNFDNLLLSENAFVNIQYKKSSLIINPVHNEYQLLTEGVADSLPNDQLENKWIDSLVGYDRSGRTVPDVTIPVKQRYGLSVRPRQSMFVNRFPIVKTTLENINTILKTKAFTDILDFNNLNLVDNPPSEILNEYDLIVDNLVDLEQIGTTKVKKAEFKVNIVNGEIDTIDIVEKGFGYKLTPFVFIEGDGTGAEVKITIDNQGRVNSVTIITSGKNYTSAVLQIRNFSVLVKVDESIKNYWAIYAWDDQRRIFYRSKLQAFNTPRYWQYIDFWQEGYEPTSRIVKEIGNIYQEPTILVEVGDLIRVKEFANGGWAVLEKTELGQGNILEAYNLVGRQNGTISILIDDFANNNKVGYDRQSSFDADLYDLYPVQELRNILKAAKEDIFKDDLRVEWNKLFFASLRYVFVEQQYIDWAFKTSFINATHNVGYLEQKTNYKDDSLDSFFEYINEVKPYRTSVREFTSKYINEDNGQTAVTDFDLPPTYSLADGKIIPIKTDSILLQEYPYKWWTDNNGYSIIEIIVSNQGGDYNDPPAVVIEGNGTGAEAKAYISNGKVISVKILSEGYGYTQTPTVMLVGGNGTSENRAKAVAVLGKSAARTFNVSLKFDRTNKNGIFQNFTFSETFTATGFTAVFNLKYPPSREKNKIAVYKNGEIVLSNQYGITLYYEKHNGLTLLHGKLTFNSNLQSGDIISVQYEKNIFLLDSVNRINQKYSPSSGMKGKEVSQLMTGIDFGGVQIQGTTFDVTGGWDALPWFTDSWDSVVSNGDFYYIADGSTTSVILPYIPAAGELISIYWKPAGTRTLPNIDTLGSDNAPQVIQIPENPAPKTIRIDDPNWIENWDSSTALNPKAQMPTFVGDGSTRAVEIGRYLSVEAGDTLIFRKLDSDGSVIITDKNLIDLSLSGGSLSHISGAYVTATGLTPDEIVIDGDKFISPDQVPAPEENVPGQVLESVSLKVYQTYPQATAPLQNKVIIANGNTKKFNIGLTILENNSIVVYVNKIKQEKSYDDIILDYTIDFATNEIVFTSTPSKGQIIEIISIGIGGIEILDYQEFIADGQTTLFLTKAVYAQTQSVTVTVDGNIVDASFSNSTSYTDTLDRTIVEFGQPPEENSVIKVICLGASLDTDSSEQSIVRVNRQEFNYDGSTNVFELDKFVNLSRAAAELSLLVTLDNVQLKGPDTELVIYDGTNNVIQLGIDPVRSVGSISYSFTKVYINNIQTIEIEDWTLDYMTNILTVKSNLLTAGDTITVVINSFADYFLSGDRLTLSDNIIQLMNSNDDSTTKNKIEVTWFSEYPSMDIVSDQYTGGKNYYNLLRMPVNESYVWVYKNGIRLTLDQDYKVDLNRSRLELNVSTTSNDYIKIVEFGNKIWSLPNGFEINKDMLNRYHYKRFSRSDIKLVKPLRYFDTTIEVNNAADFYDPSDKPLPGAVYIDNERIEYLSKNGNILGQLRRGTAGTSIKENYEIDTVVVDTGPTETIPYNEQQHRQDFVSDGSTLLVGPLDFTPLQGVRNSWYKETIPAEYGPCDQIEVFVAGARLRKNPIDVWDENLGSYSPAGDKQIEAEFSVDGSSPYIRLTSPVSAGSRITVIRRTGKIWYDIGVNTASAGKTMYDNNSPIIKFILQKTSNLPE